MHEFLDWFRLEELFQLVTLAFLLAFIGGQMTQAGSDVYRQARWFGFSTFILYAGMGLYALGPVGAVELLLIILRATLACGVGFGLALVMIPPGSVLIKQAKRWIRKHEPKPSPQPEQAWSPPPVVRDHAEEERTELERMSKVDEARTMTEKFFAPNAEILAETLPQELFAAQMRTRFLDGIGPDEAWIAAQNSIAEMIPLIKAAREKKRADDEGERKRAELAVREEQDRKATESKTSSFEGLAVWYKREQETIINLLPEGPDRDDALHQLFERYDQLMKNTYAEMKP